MTFSPLYSPDYSGEVFSPERLCSCGPDSSDSHQWILHSHRYRYLRSSVCHHLFISLDTVVSLVWPLR